MKASDLFVKSLENEGVKYIFGIPGEENLDLLESISSSDIIRFITTRHEQGAAFMADVYGRLTGKAGVCLSTLGPGATNLVTGAADANLDRSPLVAITAQASLERIHKESHQYVDVVNIFESITKWNVRVQKSSIIPEVVRKAFKIAQTEKPGACHIELPEDIAEEYLDASSLIPIRARRPSPDREALKKAAGLIDRSSQAVILAGNGVIRGRASYELKSLSEKTGIPVAETFMGKGAVPWDYELSLLTIGIQAHDYVSCDFDKADLIISIGYDMAEYSPKFWNPDGNKEIIHIDFLPAEVDIHYQPSVEIVADIRETLELLIDEVKVTKDISYPKLLRRYIINELEEKSHDNSFPVKPQRILHDLRHVMRRNDILISDVGAHKIWVARIFPACEPNTVLISNGFASMGFALPGAIAAKLIYPERRVVAACGDGGFLMNCQELETALRFGLPFVTIIFNDGSYGLIDWKQMKKFGRKIYTEFGNPDFQRLAEAFGAKGYRINNAQEIIPVLNDAFKQNVPVVIDIPVDYKENFALTEKMGRLICPM
ncbi:MAG: acetolactate synthase large subunit [Nitrospirota bacterium]